MIVFIAAIDFVKFSSKPELSSRFFGRLKFSAVFSNVFDESKLNSILHLKVEEAMRCQGAGLLKSEEASPRFIQVHASFKSTLCLSPRFVQVHACSSPRLFTSALCLSPRLIEVHAGCVDYSSRMLTFFYFGPKARDRLFKFTLVLH